MIKYKYLKIKNMDIDMQTYKITSLLGCYNILPTTIRPYHNKGLNHKLAHNSSR